MLGIIKMNLGQISGTATGESCKAHTTKFHFETSQSSSPKSNEKTLWRSVVTQAIVDATTIPRNTKMRIEKDQAINWLLSDKKDFCLVCEMADLNPQLVMHFAKEIIDKSELSLRRKKLQRRRSVRKQQKRKARKREKLFHRSLLTASA